MNIEINTRIEKEHLVIEVAYNGFIVATSNISLRDLKKALEELK